MQQGIYYDEKTKTYYVSRRYKDWKGENKRLFKRGFKTVREELNERYETFVEQYKSSRNITEELKEQDQMRWGQEMNSIRVMVEEMLNNEIMAM